jgi:DNA invertase Pin-like site-specific DNA recombinase
MPTQSTKRAEATALAYSYIRFSTPQQKLGDSLRRQVEHTAAYCAEHGLTLDESLRDEGLSGYHGAHRKKGTLGRFVARVEAGDILKGSVLIVEAFDRLSRQEPRLAQQQFLQIINAGVEIVTLIDQQRFSAKSIDSNMGQLFMSIGMMIGAHAESKNKADRIRDNWTQRRGTIRTMVPAWFVKSGDKLTQDKAKVATVRRIFKMALTMGAAAIAKQLNAEGTKVLCERRRDRSNQIWSDSTIKKILKGRQVLGIQEAGKMVDGHRQLTGESFKIYDAIINEDEWQVVQAAIESRTSGVATGRNVTRYTNLFGPLARCGVCGDRMKVVQRSRTGKFSYLACSSAAQKACDHKRYHRLDEVEKGILSAFGKAALGKDKPTADPAKTLVIRIAQAKQEADKIARSYETLFLRFADAPAGSLAGMNLTKIESDHRAKLAQITKLERELAAAKSTKPADQQMDMVKQLLGEQVSLPVEERVEARRKIAQALPSFLKAIVFLSDGRWYIQFADSLPITFRDLTPAEYAEWLVRHPVKKTVGGPTLLVAR